MTTQHLEDDINLLKGTINFLTQRIALQEQVGIQLRDAQQAELATLQSLSNELGKLKSQISILWVRQSAQGNQGKQGEDDGELPLLLKNSGNRLNKNRL